MKPILAHPLNSVCPYFTMYPLDFPLRVLASESRKNKWVYDPFCGRGTTNLAARLNGMPSVGIDSSPVAAAIAKAKVVEASVKSVVDCATQILSDARDPEDIPKGQFWKWAYNGTTLYQICQFREELLRDCGSSARDAEGKVLFPREWDDDFLDAPEIDEQKQPTVDREEMEAILRESQEPHLTLYSLLAGCGPMRPGEALGLDIHAIHPDFRTLDIVQKAKRGELQDYMKTKNADSKHGRVVDLPVALATLLREFVGARRSGLVFCKHDGSQLMQRDILKYSLHPILKKVALEQGGLNIFRRFRITAMETAEVPQALQHTWSGHARTHVSEVYKKLLKQREWRLGWAERAGMGFSLPERKNPRNAQLAQLIEFRRVG